MSSAEVTLQIKTQVGNAPPTMLQTLLNLLNLYLKPDTDREQFLKIIESDTLVFRAFLQTSKASSLNNWHASLSTEQLCDLSLALANQVAIRPLSAAQDQEPDNSALVEISRSLMLVLDSDQVREMELAARLAGTGANISEPHLKQALRYFQRPLDTLHGTDLSTRVLAVAHSLLQEEKDLPVCASLLSLDESLLEELTAPSVASEVSPDIEAQFSESWHTQICLHHQSILRTKWIRQTASGKSAPRFSQQIKSVSTRNIKEVGSTASFITRFLSP